MKKTKSTILKYAKEAADRITKNVSFLIYSVLADILFIVLTGMVFSSITLKLMQYVHALAESLQSDVAGISYLLINKTLAADMFINEATFAYNASQAFRFLAILLVAIYLIWSVFQGFAWVSCMKIVDRRWNKVVKYMTRFFLMSLVWMSLFYAFVYTWVKQSVYSSLSLFPALGQDFITGLFMSATIALCYFSMISFPLLKVTTLRNSLHKTLLFGIARYKQLVPLLLASALMFGIGLIGSLYAVRAGFVWFLVYDVLVLLPLVTFLRVYISITILKEVS